MHISQTKNFTIISHLYDVATKYEIHAKLNINKITKKHNPVYAHQYRSSTKRITFSLLCTNNLNNMQPTIHYDKRNYNGDEFEDKCI